ncbi:MAG: hypothetical protein Q9219_001121 [cf. Caloplaca sp. 3 TL-2023]
MLSYLDRINIGNARIEGLEKDLDMAGNDYNIAVQVFFVPYILLEVPSNIVLAKVAPSAWIFIIEGLLTIVVAIAARWLIVDWPEDAGFLTADERAILLHRLHKDEGTAQMDRLDRTAIKRILSDWKIWIGYEKGVPPPNRLHQSADVCDFTSGLMYLGTVVSIYSISYYLPTVLKEFGYSSSAAQVQTIPIYAVALVVALLTAYFSDRLHHRFTFVILGALINAIGYIILVAQVSLSVKVRYMALYLVESGLWIGSPVEIVWVTSNFGGHYKRAVGCAMVNGMANSAGFIASNVFVTEQAPRYPVGYGVALGMTGVAAGAATVFYAGLKKENQRRDRGERNGRLVGLGKEEVENLGDEHPGFRYGL